MPRRKDEPGFSRRSFLKTVGAGGVAAGVLAKAPASRPRRNVVGPGAVPITLNVNGQAAAARDRAARDAARRAAHARRPHGQQARLRPRRLRRLHDDRRRPDGLRVFDARDRGAGQEDPHRRRARLGQRPAASRAAGVLRQGRADVRLLHAGVRHGERRPPREAPESDAGTDQERSRRQHLPLRDVQPRSSKRCRA